MKYKVIVMIMMIFLLSGTVCGCGKKEVDYGLEGKGKAESSSSSLAQFKDAKNWTDEWNVPARDATGELEEEQMLSINAEIVVPEVDTMSVIEAEKTTIDEDFRKQFLKSFFKDGEIYYHDKEHYTKEELEKAIADLEEKHAQFVGKIQGTEGDGDDWIANDMKEELQESQKELQEWKELLPQVSDTYTVAEEFGSCTEYAGQLDDLLCQVSFNESAVLAKPLDEKYYGPETLREYDTVSQLEKSNNGDENTLNECRISMEDARSLAEHFMNKIGRSNQVCLEEKNLMWYGENTEKKSNAADEKYAVYGYSFTYGTGIDGIDFANFDMFPSCEYFGPYWWELEAHVNEKLNNGDSITITVTDEGITEISLKTPLDIRNVNSQVKLLPLDVVKDIMKNEVMEHPEKYYFDYDSNFNQMELAYIKSKDNSQEDVFSYVPTWCLSSHAEGASMMHPIFVNAIDGSIVYLYQE